MSNTKRRKRLSSNASFCPASDGRSHQPTPSMFARQRSATRFLWYRGERCRCGFAQSQLDARLLSRSQGFGSLPIEQGKLAVRALRHEVDAARQPLWLRIHCSSCPVRRKTWAQPVWNFDAGSHIRVSHLWPSLTSSHRALQNQTEPS